MYVTGELNEQRLRRLISAFYVRVREDELLGPVFAGTVTDWPAHIDLLTDFWSSVMLTSGRYKGNPIASHAQHRAAITPAHFDRWLGLWSEVTSERMPPSAAQALQSKAARIAESMKLALYFKLPTTQKGASS